MVRFLRLLPLGCVLAACSPPAVCPGGADAAVLVQLTDGGDLYLDDASVSFIFEQSDEKDCTSSTMNDAPVYECGQPNAGDYTINVSIPGRQDVSEQVSVEFADCRLQQAELEIEIGEECAVTTAPSVLVTVLDLPSGLPLEDAQVKYKNVDDATSPLDCEVSDALNAVWSCGDNEAGNIEIYALKFGYITQQETTRVRMGPCHVETVSLVMELVPNE